MNFCIVLWVHDLCEKTVLVKWCKILNFDIRNINKIVNTFEKVLLYLDAHSAATLSFFSNSESRYFQKYMYTEWEVKQTIYTSDALLVIHETHVLIIFTKQLHIKLVMFPDRLVFGQDEVHYRLLDSIEFLVNFIATVYIYLDNIEEVSRHTL